MRKIILASASPRRKELLEQIGMEFTILPAQGEECSSRTLPQEVVVDLANGKAREVYCRLQQENAELSDIIVIGADTIVVYEGQILGKPADKNDACETLARLSGHTHEVYTGVSLTCCEDGKMVQYSFAEKTTVTMYLIDEKEISAYVEGGEPMDKAGSYGIQGQGVKFIERIEGDYNNVVGLPIAKIYQQFKQLGIAIS